MIAQKRLHKATNKGEINAKLDNPNSIRNIYCNDNNSSSVDF